MALLLPFHATADNQYQLQLRDHNYNHNHYVINESLAIPSPEQTISTCSVPTVDLQNHIPFCLTLLQSLFPRSSFVHLASQGGCSITFQRNSSQPTCTIASCPLFPHQPTTMVQCRLYQHSIPLVLAQQACQIYAPYAPRTKGIHPAISIPAPPCPSPPKFPPQTFQIVEMAKIHGVPAATVLSDSRLLDSTDKRVKMRTLLSSLAHFLGRGWIHARPHTPCAGRVGATIIARLDLLQRDLPTLALRAFARRIRREVHEGGLERLPVSLTHGDLIPANLIVDENTWRLRGVVDWAEAEFLPFGMGLYGVEQLLGFVSDENGEFEWMCEAGELRTYFWDCLVSEIPALKMGMMRRNVVLAKAVGILLWKGIAWDDGRIDRVVNELDDGVDLKYLEAFVGIVEQELLGDLDGACRGRGEPVQSQNTQDEGSSSMGLAVSKRNASL